MKLKKRIYTQEFRENAIKLGKEMGPTEAGKQLKMPPETLSGWICKEKRGELTSVKPKSLQTESQKKTKELEQEIKMLKSENTQLREENKILEGVSDITEWKAKDGKLYTAGIFGCFDSTYLGLGIAENMKTELVEESLNQAAGRFNLKGAISHSDRGSQYTSERHLKNLKLSKV